MRTAMHQRAFPGEDISGRPEPEVAAAALLRLLGQRPPSGRYVASDYPAAGLHGGQPAGSGGDPVSRPASRPPEARGLTRDGVRLLAATPDGLAHARFRDLPRFLAPGDLLVVNNSATLAAAIPGQRAGGTAVTVHLSNQLDDGTWLVELRTGPPVAARLTDGVPGEIITLPGGGSVTLLHPYPDPPYPAGEPPGSGPRCCPRVPSRCRTTWPGTASRSAIPTSRTAGRSPPTRRCSPAPRAARRWPARPGRSPLSWSPG